MTSTGVEAEKDWPASLPLLLKHKKVKDKSSVWIKNIHITSTKNPDPDDQKNSSLKWTT